MKKITAFLLALIMMLSLAACGTKQEPTVSDTPDRGNTTAATENAAPTTDVVRGGSLKIAKTMDMTNNSFAMFHSTYSQADAYVLDQIIETPIKINEDGSFVPSLAESWEFTEDGLGLKLKLRSDVTFSNGTPLTAQGVADLYNYYITEECGHKQKSSDLALVTGTDVVDENTIQINTSSPDAGLLTALSGISFYVYAPENLANDDFATNPIGTGPFVLKEYKEGDHITLARRNDYYLMGEDGSLCLTSMKSTIRFFPTMPQRLQISSPAMLMALISSPPPTPQSPAWQMQICPPISTTTTSISGQVSTLAMKCLQSWKFVRR